MITLEEALAQRRAYNTMVGNCTVRQIKIQMHHSWTEWRKVTMQLQELAEQGLGDEYAIALFCEVVPGQLVFYESNQSDTARVVRKMENGGQTTLHVEPDGRAAYMNFAGPTSPVVVLDVRIERPEPEGPSIPDADGNPVPTPDLGEEIQP